MKLKTRIIISFFIIILEPLICTAAAFWGFSQYQLKMLEKQYGIENATYESLSNTAEVINNMTNDIEMELRNIAQNTPGKFESLEYLAQVNEELKEMHSYLLVRKEDQVTYYGCESYPSELVKRLPGYSDKNTDSGISNNDGFYLGGHLQSLVKQINFKTEDKTEGSVFIISNIFKTLPQIEELIRSMMVTAVLILIVTGLVLTWWIYRGVIAPLDKLRTATQKIKEGNLDFSIVPEGVSEISDLCRDFEEMRYRLKETSEEKIQFDKENKELISNISHDLKTPITAIKGYVEGIMDGVANTPEKMDKYIRTIYNKATDMDRLIDELFLYSKLDSNSMNYSFANLNLKDYFEDCVDEISLDLESRGISLEYRNYVPEDTIIIADPEQLKRVINNIVGNSVKYMGARPGRIRIFIKNETEFVQVDISDNGTGIAKKELPHIFERCYRTDASRNSSKGGSGLGLSIAKKIIEEHGGKIWANSVENEGTTLSFVLRKYKECVTYE